MFRWIRESIALMYKEHTHPMPMTALIFIYMETFGKALLKNNYKSSEKKVVMFIKNYMHELMCALCKNILDFEDEVLVRGNTRKIRIGTIFGDYYRNGLVHEFWGKEGCIIFENKTKEAPKNYLWLIPKNENKIFAGINIDYLVPDFLNALEEYERTLYESKKEAEALANAMCTYFVTVENI